MVKPPLRTKSVGTKVSEAEFALLEVRGRGAYDGDGDRVATTNCNVVNAGNGSTSGINKEFFYDFTGKMKDPESTLDYFGARYYNSNMGRFMSPDWTAKIEPVPYSKLDNPQSLNLYSYVQNNPLSNLDDDGHATIEVKYLLSPLAVSIHLSLSPTATGHKQYFGPVHPSLQVLDGLPPRLEDQLRKL